MKLIKCDESYKGKSILFKYTSEYYYDLEMDHFNINFVRKPFGEIVEKSFTDTLLNEWLGEAELYRLEEDGKMLGIIELSKENWNNRLRISNIWIDENYRHQGLGTLLIKQAFLRAKELNVRAIVLETQTCNDKAISFYLKQGFELIGFDSMSYSNCDIRNKEVRIEMGIDCKRIADKV